MSPLTRWILIIILSIGLFVVLSRLFAHRGPDLRAYERLHSPAIAIMPAQKMLVVEVTGDPNVVGPKAMGLLFKTYFRMPSADRMAGHVAPRARWPLPLDTPKDRWIGRYALPVRPGAALSVVNDAGSATVGLVDWEYGPVAQILHVGPYDREAPTIRRLEEFIASQGYERIGDHEEEYLKGPGVLGKGDPEKYYTIIRFRVKRSKPARTDIIVPAPDSASADRQ